MALTDGERALQIRVDRKLKVTLVLDLTQVCKNLIKDRMERSGMRWGEQMAEAIVSSEPSISPKISISIGNSASNRISDANILPFGASLQSSHTQFI